MGKTATVRARMEPDLKERAEQVFHGLGMAATDAITLFYTQVDLRHGLPFEVKIPNAVTRRTFEATDRGEDPVVCADVDDRFRRLGATYGRVRTVPI